MPDSDALERLKNRSRPTVFSRDASLSPTPASPEIQSLQTKQSTMRLEAGVSDRLQSLCREKGVFREVLIEAMFEYCERNPGVLEAVLVEANNKNEYRQRIANQKRAKSMMERFG